MDNYVRELINQIHDLLHRIDGYLDAKADLKPALRFVTDEPVILKFNGKVKIPDSINESGIQLKKITDVGTSDEDLEEGFVYFTDKEIEQMPKKFRKLIIVNRKRCRMRKHESGKNTTTYEIRYRRDGYELSASGKTIELAKANMIEKMKIAKPKEKRSNERVEIPTTFTAFSLYYFKNFRMAKVAAETFKYDNFRFKRYLQPFFLETPIKKITPFDCKKCLDEVRATGKSKTVDELYSLLSIIFKGAIAHALIDRSPMDTVLHIPHERESGTALTKEEENKLLQSVHNTIYETATALTLFCGLRPNELKEAKIQGEFIVTVNSKRKTKKTEYKRIPICKRLRELLPENGEFYIPDLNRLRGKIKNTLPNHKLYDLRTTFYSRCKEFNVEENALKEFAGHSLGVLGNAYTDLSDEYLLKEGKKLDEW